MSDIEYADEEKIINKFEDDMIKLVTELYTERMNQETNDASEDETL